MFYFSLVSAKGKNILLFPFIQENQLLRSDYITYFKVNGRVYYLTFILDAYTRFIVGYHVSMSLRTEHTTLPVLQKVIDYLIKLNMTIKNQILNSDDGGHFYDKDFLILTANYHIQNSMCQYPWENSKTERINGITKNNYLKHLNVRTFEQLTKEVDRSVQLYNHEKPHIMLKRKTPFQFENSIFVQHWVSKV